jgi:phosphoglycolate phosphatase
MEYEGVVYDLDGTLVRLAVDWAAAHETVIERLAAHEVDAAQMSLWEILSWADDNGAAPVVETAIADHERTGARAATRLPTAEELPLSVPVGVCSLNCEEACRIALDRHSLAEHVDTVVGRDSVDGRKPDPEPLLRTVERLGVSPDAALFVGDSERDEQAALGAGVDFEYVSERVAVSE